MVAKPAAAAAAAVASTTTSAAVAAASRESAAAAASKEAETGGATTTAGSQRKLGRDAFFGSARRPAWRCSRRWQAGGCSWGSIRWEARPLETDI